MPPGATQATGLPVGLLKTAVQTFERLGQQQGGATIVVQYQLGRANRMLGDLQFCPASL